MPHLYSSSVFELMNFLQLGRELDIIPDINLIMKKLIKFSYLNFSLFSLTITKSILHGGYLRT